VDAEATPKPDPAWKGTEMSRETKQASLVAIALLLTMGWLTIGCAGDATADHPYAEIEGETAGAVEERSTPASDRSASSDRSGPSFLDRLLGERTREVVVPAGTEVDVRFSETVSSRSSATGETFRTTVDRDVVVGDAVAIPAGSVIVGHITEAHQPQSVGGRARLSLAFSAVELPSGESAAIDGTFAARGKSQNLKDAGIIAGSTAGGVILGEAIDDGEGGIIGGILGGLGGALAAKKTKGKPVEVPAGTVMAIELVQPVTLEIPA
jgi:hypothetical protein